MRDSLQLKSFWNFLQRNKLFTAINIFGFAVSLMFVVLIGLYVQDELSVGREQPNRNRIYRLRNEEFSEFSAPIAADLRNRYPEIEATLRIVSQNWPVTDGDQEGIREEVLLADTSFTAFFELPWVEGSPATALRTRDDALISQSCARAWFGSEPALGKSLRVNGRERIVSGVYRDLKTTHLKPVDIILPFENVVEAYDGDILNDYGRSIFDLYVMTAPHTALTPERADEIHAWLQSFYWVYRNGIAEQFIPESGDDLYFTELPASYMRSNNRTFLLVLGITALVILLFAVINYINLSVAQSGFRAQEVAMRRLLGGSRKSLFAGFIVESLLLCLVSFGIALLLASSVEGWFREVMQTDISLKENLTTGNIALALGGIVAIGLVSGLMPAYVLTRAEPIDVVRGMFRRQTKMVYSKILIAFQYCITIVLLGSMITISRQLDFMCRSDLGFTTSNTFVMAYAPGPNGTPAGLRSALLSVPGVEGIGYSRGIPGFGTNSNTFERNGRQISIQWFPMDSAAFRMFDFTVVRHFATDDREAVWLNESAWNRMELTETEPEFRCWGATFRVAGVLRDFFASDMTRLRGPVLIQPMGDDSWPIHVLVRVSGDDPVVLSERIRNAYMAYNGGDPVVPEFYDGMVARQYDHQQRTARIIGAFSLLAIVISALGMLAMATYFMRQREREVAVRKVFGSTSRQALTRVMAAFLKLVGVAFVVAVPIILYLMREWLSGYAYRIPLSWTIFALAGAMALAIAGSAVGWQSWRTARANPVDVLRK
ncbi:ABC transporter permease [uncultured Rikenella sp.]|uniref:ABC transporter permease n=1 Tax=uncultured Rikenella sp. TaxID=368003 RepID=UPI002618EFD9|nr:ABC transporter permease [uncultured Rikenella sp.]